MLVKKFFVGIDPGMTGAAAVIRDDGTIAAIFKDDPPMEVVSFLREHPHVPVSITVEKVWAMPGQGVTSMFTFGVGFGRIQGILEASGYKFTLLPAATWQGYLPLASTPKERVKAFCEANWGFEAFMFERARTPHKGAMDAAAIAEYGRRVDIGLLERKKELPKKKRRREISF